MSEENSKNKEAERQGEPRPPTRMQKAMITLCAGCEVRRSCAEASVQPPPVLLMGPDDYGRGTLRHTHRPQTWEEWGVWSGVLPTQRKLVVETLGRGEEAVNALLAIGARMAREHPGDVGMLSRIGEPPKRLKRVDKRRVKRFEQGGKPGPGRGKRGPIALYALEHGVSRATAWRRLRAAA